MKRDLDERDIELFLDKKSSDHPEIERWSDTTRAKVIQVIFRILKESGLLLNNKLNSLNAPKDFWYFFQIKGEVWFFEYSLLNKEQRERFIKTK